MQRGLKEFLLRFGSFLLSEVSMQRGLKVKRGESMSEEVISSLNAKRIESEIICFTGRYEETVSLNAKRIESLLLMMSETRIKALVSMQRGLKEIYQHVATFKRNKSQCKEDWKMVLSSMRSIPPYRSQCKEDWKKSNPPHRGRHQPAGLSQCKEDWKFPSITRRPIPRSLCLNAKRIERFTGLSIRLEWLLWSQCKEDWKNLKHYVPVVYLDARLNAKRIERFLGFPVPALRIVFVSMQRGLKGKSCKTSAMSRLGLNAKRIES